MLILERRLHERVMIGHDIMLEVTGIRSGSVRIGISAPSDVSILRDELIDDRSGRPLTPPIRPRMSRRGNGRRL